MNTFEDLKNKVTEILDSYKENPALVAELVQFRAQFYKYSMKNSILIQEQNPHSTFVASFLAWKEKGYSVKKGESGIAIFVPVNKKTFFRSPDEPSVSLKDATASEKKDIASGKISTHEQLVFKKGTVFDISQTTCPVEDYPKIYHMGYPDSTHKQLFESMRKFAEKSGFTVSIKDVHSIGLGGYYNPETDSIVISDKLQDTRQLSTMCHELAHGLMHKSSTQPKPVVEFEAESLSIMMVTRMGLPVSESRQRYISEYYKRIDQSKYSIEESFTRIQKAYNFITDGFENELGLAPQQAQSFAVSKAALESTVSISR